jgi:eukaryotic-like serine/threonine-protein kinase
MMLNSKESLNSQGFTKSDSQMNNRQNILLLTFAVLSLLLQISVQIVFAQGEVQQKNGNNISFVPYENPTYGIKIRYPADWQKTEHLSGNRFWVNFVSPIKNTNANTFPATVTVSVEGLNHSISADNATGKFVTGIIDSAKRSLSDFQIIESNPNANITGTSAHKIVYTFLSQDPAVQAHFQSMNIWSAEGKKVYSISYTELKPLYASYLPIVQKIVDSFEITKR